MDADWAQTVILAVALLVSALALVFERRTLHSQDRLNAYRDFLSAQSRWRDAYRRADELMAAGKIEDAYALLNERRDATWTALAIIRIASPQAVVDAATALNSAVAAESPTKGSKRRPLNNAEHKSLVTGFVAACRKDLGRRRIRL